MVGHVALIPSMLAIRISRRQQHEIELMIRWETGSSGRIQPAIPELGFQRGGRSLRAVLFNLMLQRFTSTVVAEWITN